MRPSGICSQTYNGCVLKDARLKTCDACNFIIPVKKPKLRFNKEHDEGADVVSSFKILQLTDLHFGGSSWSNWGPEQDWKSAEAIKTYLKAENLDLVILSGDQITALNIDKNATKYYQNIIDAMLEADPDFKWATIFGNHDYEHQYKWTYDDGNTVEHDAKATRDDLVRLDMVYSGSYTM
jgi:predicted MPP superfamily phosphohydrolase